MRRSRSLLRERHFPAEADRCVHIPNMLSIWGRETRTTPLILAVRRSAEFGNFDGVLFY